MASLTHTVYDVYTYLTEDLASPVTKNWFLVGKPQNLLLILAGYLYFCTTLGPRYMQNRRPYNLKNFIKIYNIFQILISLYFFYETTQYIFFTDFNFYCQGANDPNSVVGKKTAFLAWLYLMMKVIDLLDTVIFVLRKSNRQITQLHLHHHTLMPLIAWLVATYTPGFDLLVLQNNVLQKSMIIVSIKFKFIFVRVLTTFILLLTFLYFGNVSIAMITGRLYGRGGQSAIVGQINCFVHAVMYTYYLLASLGDEYKKYLWWKKYLTLLQLVQFAIIGAHSVRSLFYPCSYPTALKILTCFYAVIFIKMFSQFYYNSYIKATNTKSNGPPKVNTKMNVNGQN